MPARPLRRSYSSPAGRPTPYPTSSSSTRAHGGQPRRSSGSDTLGRRVLADLDWWRVHGAQTPPAESSALAGRDENGLEQGSLPRREASPATTTMQRTGWNGLALFGDAEVDTLAVDWNAYEQQVAAPLHELATLSIAPSSPVRSTYEISPSSSPIMSHTSPALVTDYPALPPFMLNSSPASPPLAHRRARPGALSRSASASCAEFSDYNREQMSLPDVSLADLIRPTRAHADAASAFPDLFQ